MYNANDKFMPWCENQQSSQDANPPNTLHISCKLSCCTQHSTADLCWIAFDVMSNTIESNVAWTTALKRFWVVDWQWHLCIFGLASGKVHFADLPDELLCDSGKVAAATDSRYKSQALCMAVCNKYEIIGQYHLRDLIRILYCAMFWSRRSTQP